MFKNKARNAQTWNYLSVKHHYDANGLRLHLRKNIHGFTDSRACGDDITQDQSSLALFKSKGRDACAYGLVTLPISLHERQIGASDELAWVLTRSAHHTSLGNG